MGWFNDEVTNTTEQYIQDISPNVQGNTAPVLVSSEGISLTQDSQGALDLTEKILAGAGAIVQQQFSSVLDSVKGAVNSMENLASDTSADMRDVSTESIGLADSTTREMRALSEYAIKQYSDFSTDVVQDMGDLSSRSIDFAEVLSLGNQDLFENMTDSFVTVVDSITNDSLNLTERATDGALEFASNATRSEASLNTETLIKFGAFSVTAIAFAVIAASMKGRAKN